MGGRRATAGCGGAFEGKEAPRRARPRALSWLAALGVVLACALACCAPEPAHAEAPASISGTCYVECTNPQIDGAAGGNRFRVSFPQYGIEADGFCTSGPLYGTPLPGHYPFTGTRTDDGGYRIAVDCSGAAMYPNHYSPHGAQNVGGFSIFLHGSVEVRKHAPEGYADAVPEATLAGARYEAVAADGSVVAELITDADGYARADDVPIGAWTLREVAPSHGYDLDAGPRDIVVEGGGVARADSWEQPLRGAVGVTKASAAPEITEGSPCYSLAGAVYGVYADAPCEREMQRIVTDEAGAGQCAPELWPGAYWIKEIAPPPGFALDEQAHAVTLSIEGCEAETVARARTTDVPQLVPVDEIVAKADAETGLAEAQGDATLAGAKFLVEHYAGSFESAEDIETAGAEPTLALAAVTDEKGVARVADSALPDAGAGPGLPLGTVAVREVRPPSGYLLSEEAVAILPVTAQGAGPLDGMLAASEVAEQVIRGDIEIVKTGAAPDGPRPLAGVAFDIVHEASGRAVARLVTDEQGFATTAQPDGQGLGALPFGAYLVREDPATTPEGYLPAPAFAVDVAEHGHVCRLTIENEAAPVAPGESTAVETGDPVRTPALLAACIAASALAVVLAAHLRRSRSD